MTAAKTLFTLVAIALATTAKPSVKCNQARNFAAVGWTCPRQDPLKLGETSAMFLLYKPNNTPMLIKVQEYETKEQKALVDREHEVLSAVKDMHIVKMHRFIVDPQANLCYTLLEYGESGNLKEFIENNPSFMDDPRELVRLFLRIVQGVQTLHNAGYIHGQISDQNILINAIMIPKLIDFKYAFKIGSPDVPFAYKNFWADPRLLKSTSVIDDPKVDVYALGVVLYQLAHQGKTPFDKSQLKVLAATPEKLRIAINNDVEKHVAILINKLIQNDPKTRPDLASIITEIDAYLKSDKDEFIGEKFVSVTEIETPESFNVMRTQERIPDGTVIKGDEQQGVSEAVLVEQELVANEAQNVLKRRRLTQNPHSTSFRQKEEQSASDSLGILTILLCYLIFGALMVSAIEYLLRSQNSKGQPLEHVVTTYLTSVQENTQTATNDNAPLPE